MRMRVLGTLLTAAAVTTAGMAAPAQAAPAEGPVFGIDVAGAIPGQYIVTLRAPVDGGGTGTSTGVSAQSLGGGTGTSSGVSAQSLGGATYLKRMTAAEARRLAARPDVQFVEQD